MIVLVCGGRSFQGKALVFNVLDEIHKKRGIDAVICGGAKGADTLGRMWAEERGVECREYKPDWEKHGKAAGVIRNQEMLDKESVELVVAFPGESGTRDMIHRAKKSDIDVITFIRKDK